MADSLVHRATSDQLIGPDWAMNMEICDILNRDPGQAKDSVKALKKRIAHKSPKVQLLALTLLETIVKNCGDIVHMHVAERDLPHEMVRLARKKADPHVKEKILVLIDTWQEAFGGPRARYPQYFAAYHELLRAGAVFPQRSERTAPYFNPQVTPAGAYPAASARSPDFQKEEPESSTGSEFPALNLSEIQNARGIMDVLSEMLNALDPGNREGIRQEVIVDLVAQCRNYKQRVVHLVNSTGDEDLLAQGLALNDDLQRVLGKHDAIAAGIPFREEKGKEKESGKPIPRSLQQLVEIEDSTKNQNPSNETNNESGDSHALVPVSVLEGGTDGSAAATSAKPDPMMDLLSFDSNPTEPATGTAATGTTENSLALVPVDPFSNPDSNPNPVSNAGPGDLLALVEMYPQTGTTVQSTGPNPNLMGSPTQAQPFGIANQQQVQGIYGNGNVGQNSVANPVAGALTPFDQVQLNQSAGPAWNNGQMAPQGINPQPQTGEYDAQGGDVILPPWETQPEQNNPALAVVQQPGNMQMGQMAGQPGPMQQQQPGPMQMGQMGQMGQMAGQPGPMQMGQMGQMGQMAGQPGPMQQQQPGPMQMGQMGQMGQYGMYPQQMAMYGQMGQMGYGYMQQDASQYYAQMGQMGQMGYGYNTGTTDLSQGMYGLSVQDNRTNNSYSGAPMVQSSRPAKPEDKLFGDLVSFAKSKPK